jgi:AmiR/NasT family two-component response regulator
LAAKVRADGLQTAMQTRHVIGMAQGILMQRYNLDADRAFAVLPRTSQDNNVKLHEVAKRLVDERRTL